jgi:hypothetical protein
MTIVNETVSARANGNGVQTVFSYNFLIPDQGQAVLYFTNPAGVMTEVPQTDWLLDTINNPNGGQFTYPRVGSGAAVAPSGSTLTLVRTVPNIQSTNLRNQGAYYPQVVEAALDTLAMQTQQLQAYLDRSLQFPISDASDLSSILATEFQRAGKILGFGADGAPLLYSITGSTLISYEQWAGIAGGTANDKTLTPAPPITAYTEGQAFAFINGPASNTGAMTVDVSGLGPRALVRPNGSALGSGDVVANTLLTAQFDGINFRLVTIGQGVFQATETVPGIAEVATNAEINAGTDDQRFVTPLKLQTRLGNRIVPATESAAGIAEIATQAEANGIVDDTRFLTPKKLAGRLVPATALAATYTVVAADNGRPLNATGTWVLNLTAAATLGDGFTVSVRNVGSGVITVTPAAAELINGAATLSLPAGSNATLECNGTGWITTTLYRPTLEYNSGQQVLTLGGALILPHGLGGKPKTGDIHTAFECVTAQFGWVPGDFMEMPAVITFAGVNAGFVVWSDATNIYVQFGNAAVGVVATRPGGGAQYTTPANWRLHVRATRVAT